jgi:hypothetical protein
MAGFPWGILGTGNHQYIISGPIKQGTFLSSSLTWATIPAGGINGQVQFNLNGSLAGSSGLTWNGVNLYVNGLAVATVNQLPQACGDTGEIQFSDGMGGFVSDPAFTFDSLAGLNISLPVVIEDSLAVTLSIIVGKDLEFLSSINGIIVRSPNGNRWRFTIDNTGALNSTVL